MTKLILRIKFRWCRMFHDGAINRLRGKYTCPVCQLEHVDPAA